MNKTVKKRILAGALAVVTVLPLAGGALAAPPAVSTDEAVYVNLDYYGALSDMRIVKGVSLNGEASFTDYGNYAGVYNMSTYDKPELTDGAVSWNLSNPDKQRFYYECIPADTEGLQMPWTFDVSYKLDGVPVKAEKLAGANGLMEITVHAVPNAKASDYYKNNMTLMLMTGIDMDKTSSIDAPGAQIQSLGSYKMVVFLGLPGEDNTYTIRIGSDQFESTGLVMMMAPATMSQLDRISDFRDLKDKVNGAEDDVYAGLSDLLTTVNSMQSSLTAMSAGIAGLNEVRKQLIDARGTMDPDMDQSLAALQKLVDQMDSMVPELTRTQETLTGISKASNSLLEKVTDSREDLAAYQKSLKDIHTALGNLEDLIDELENQTSASDITIASMENALKTLSTQSTNLSGSLADMVTTFQELAAYIGTLPAEQQQEYALLTTMLPSVNKMLTSTKTLMGAVAQVSSSTASMVGLLGDYQEILDDNNGIADDFVSIGKKLAEQGQETLSKIDAATYDLEDMQETLDGGTNDLKSILQKSADLLTTTKTTLASANQTLSDLQSTLRAVRQQADDHTAQSIDGLLDMMQKAINSSGTTDSLKKANSTIHNSINDEIDDLENDTNVLNMDNSLALESFTSHQNPAPASLQFVLRTKEISVDEQEEAQTEAQDKADEGVFHRIVNIFSRIYDALSAAFTGND